MHTTSISCHELDRNGADVRTRHDQGVLVGTSYNCDSSVLHSSLMLSVARGLSLGLRVTPRLPGRLLKLRPPPIANPPLALYASRQFSSTRPKSAKYFRFEVDPEQPLNYRRWNTGTQIFGGIVVLSAAYYALQYAPRSLRCARYSRVCSLETVPETGRWRFMDASPKFETRVRLKHESTANSASYNRDPLRWQRCLTRSC